MPPSYAAAMSRGCNHRKPPVGVKYKTILDECQALYENKIMVIISLLSTCLYRKINFYVLSDSGFYKGICVFHKTQNYELSRDVVFISCGKYINKEPRKFKTSGAYHDTTGLRPGVSF